MIALFALSALLVADPALNTTITVGGGPGVASNSTVTYVTPMAALNVDVDFGGWYAGGGLGVHTFIEPRFFGEESLANRAGVDVIARVGLNPVRTERFRVLADVSLIPSLQYISVEDGDSYYLPLPAGAVDVRGELNITDDLYLQAAAGLFVNWSNSGLVLWVPHVLLGFGARFD